MNKHIINKNTTLLEALSRINSLSPSPLVLFVVDDNNRMVGTLTDGDSRRALIKGASLLDKVEKVMYCDFRYLQQGANFDIYHLREQKRQSMKLVPILDGDRHIIEIIDLEHHKSMLPVDAVLMAGGKGERLRPLTEKTPKPLLKIGKKAIIDYNIENLISYGVSHISVTVNYLKEQLEEHFAKPICGVQVNTVREPEFLGTLGSIQFIHQFYNDTVLVMNSDLFTNIDFESFYLNFMDTGADMAAAAVPYSVSVPYGIFEVNDNQGINGIVEKPTYNYYANAGIYLIKREVIEEFIPKNHYCNATDFMDILIKGNRKVVYFPLSGYWIDIGNKQEFSKAQDIIRYL